MLVGLIILGMGLTFFKVALWAGMMCLTHKKFLAFSIWLITLAVAVLIGIVGLTVLGPITGGIAAGEVAILVFSTLCGLGALGVMIYNAINGSLATTIAAFLVLVVCVVIGGFAFAGLGLEFFLSIMMI